MEIELKPNEFDKQVLESTKPVLVDFWASWCGPCKMLAPYIKEIAKTYEGKLKVCKLNVDEAGEIATRYAIMSIPTLMLFKDGKIMNKRVGMMTKGELEKFIHPYI